MRRYFIKFLLENFYKERHGEILDQFHLAMATSILIILGYLCPYQDMINNDVYQIVQLLRLVCVFFHQKLTQNMAFIY